MALIGTNKTEPFAVNLILCRKIKFTAKSSFVFIRVISGQYFPFYLRVLRVLCGKHVFPGSQFRVVRGGDGFLRAPRASA